MDEEKYHDILLKEYGEAAARCRNYEQLTTSLPTLLTPFVALAGLLLSVNLHYLGKVSLAIVGLVIASCIVANVYPQHANYLFSVKRIKEIEGLVKRDEQRVMSLYTGGPSATVDSRTVSWTLVAFCLFILFFAGLAIVAVVGEGAIFEAPDTVSGTGTVAPPPPPYSSD